VLRPRLHLLYNHFGVLKMQNLVHTIKEESRNRGVAPLILNLGDGWMDVSGEPHIPERYSVFL
jgi:hypothetical protein